MNSVTREPFVSCAVSVPRALDAADFPGVLEAFCASHPAWPVVLKPNCVNASRFPVTTRPELVEAVVEYVRSHCGSEIVIAEGCGDPRLETSEVFRRLGYEEVAERLGVPLVDLNHAPLVRLERPERPLFPEMWLPVLAMDCLLVSLPVLKAHSLADFTGTIKNMMGLLPPKHYSGRHGTWKKAVFHGRMQESLSDLAAYRLPDFTLLDASVGLRDYHLGGPCCDPPPNLLLAGADPYAMDREACGLLGVDWKNIGHLRGPRRGNGEP